MVSGAISGEPSSSPSTPGNQRAWVIAMSAEQIASSAPTDRSMLRMTMMNTMPVAMIATETVWIVRLKMLRGLR